MSRKASNPRKTVGITASTGILGRTIVKQLKNETNLRIVALLTMEQLSSDVEKFLENFDNVLRQDPDKDVDLKDIDYLLLLPSNSENRVQQVKNYVNAAKNANVEFILLQSILDVGKKDLFGTQFRQMEDIVQDSRIACCFVRCTFFMENFLLQTQEIQNGEIHLPIGKGRTAPVSIEDLARLIVTILKDVPQHQQHVYDLAGPEVLDGEALAQSASRALNRQIRFVDEPAEKAVQALMDKGVPSWQASGMVAMLQVYAAQKFVDVQTNKEFEEMVGEDKKAITVYDFFLKNRQLFGGQRAEYQERGQGMSGQTVSTAQLTNQMTTQIDSIRKELQNLITKREQMLKTVRDQHRRDEQRLAEFERVQNKIRKTVESRLGSRDWESRAFAIRTPETTPPRQTGYIESPESSTQTSPSQTSPLSKTSQMRPSRPDFGIKESVIGAKQKA